MVGLVVPVMKNFKGFTELIQSVDISVKPYIHNNWDNNVGVSKAWNQQINKAIKDGQHYIVVVNDDVIFGPKTINKFLQSLDKGFDLVSAIGTERFDHKLEESYDDGFPDFACFAITKDTINRFGYFDENIHSYFNDNDYSHRIRTGGGRQGVRKDAYMIHKGSVTQFWEGRDNGVISHQAFEDARNYYISKWGGQPREETFTTPFNSGKDLKDW